jgi:hypothetical protein
MLAVIKVIKKGQLPIFNFSSWRTYWLIQLVRRGFFRLVEDQRLVRTAPTQTRLACRVCSLTCALVSLRRQTLGLIIRVRLAQLVGRLCWPRYDLSHLWLLHFVAAFVDCELGCRARFGDQAAATQTVFGGQCARGWSGVFAGTVFEAAFGIWSGGNLMAYREVSCCMKIEIFFS